MITCPSCNRQYAWKPQFAGKQLPCKCGATLAIPLHDPAMPVPRPLDQTKIIIGGVVLVLLALAGGYTAFVVLGNSRQPAAAAPPPPPLVFLPDGKTPTGRDADVLRLHQEIGAHEVLKWLDDNQGGGIIGFLWTRELTAKAARQWYDHGAKTVLAFGSTWTTDLAIELPDDPAKRKYFFDYAIGFNNQIVGLNTGFPTSGARDPRQFQIRPPQTEEGQKYLLLEFMDPTRAKEQWGPNL
jgi:hypothetical protein